MSPPRSPATVRRAVAALLLVAAGSSRAQPLALAAGPDAGLPPDPGAGAPPAAVPPAIAPPAGTAPPAAAPAEPELQTFLLELGAYYTSAGVYLPLTREPVPNLGERGEVDLYWALLPRTIVPRFVVLEASVNPMPCVGLLVRDRAPHFYDRAQLDRNTNLVRAVTAGFEEPWAASVFVGNVADFDVRGRKEFEGKGYFGLVFSGGNLHIKDNVAIRDDWLEAELKLKGDRRSPAQKLSWSFRVGVKLHANHDVVDQAYVGIRRSRVDYVEGPPVIANSGVEYKLDLGLDGTPLRHYFIVDKKWPTWSTAFSLGLGVVYDTGRSYRGGLARDAPERVQVLVRPNVEF